jgi:HEAT repeat protein
MVSGTEKNSSRAYYTLVPGSGVYALVHNAASGTCRECRLRAITALGKSGDPRAVRPLADLLLDGDPDIRFCATEALGTLRSGRAVDDLAARLRDRSEEPRIRMQAAAALASIRSTGALRGLAEFIDEKSGDEEIRAYVRELVAARPLM